MLARLRRLFRPRSKQKSPLDPQSRAEVEREQRNAELAAGEHLGSTLGGMHYSDTEFHKPR